jgi:hypothetical protein
MANHESVTSIPPPDDPSPPPVVPEPPSAPEPAPTPPGPTAPLVKTAHEAFALQDARRSPYGSDRSAADAAWEEREPILLAVVRDFCSDLRRRVNRLGNTNLAAVVEATGAVERAVAALLACPPLKVDATTPGTDERGTTHCLYLYAGNTYVKHKELRDLHRGALETIDGLRPWLEAAGDATRGEDDSAFVSVSTLLRNDPRMALAACSRFLDNHPEIRQRKQGNRRKVHSGDWHRYWEKEDRERARLDSETEDDYGKVIEKRKAIERVKKKRP